jgi:hypothetical protein
MMRRNKLCSNLCERPRAIETRLYRVTRYLNTNLANLSICGSVILTT